MKGACMQNTDISIQVLIYIFELSEVNDDGFEQAEYANEEKLIPQAASILAFMELIGSSVGLAFVPAYFSLVEPTVSDLI